MKKIIYLLFIGCGLKSCTTTETPRDHDYTRINNVQYTRNIVSDIQFNCDVPGDVCIKGTSHTIHTRTPQEKANDSLAALSAFTDFKKYYTGDSLNKYFEDESKISNLFPNFVIDGGLLHDIKQNKYNIIITGDNSIVICKGNQLVRDSIYRIWKWNE